MDELLMVRSAVEHRVKKVERRLAHARRQVEQRYADELRQGTIDKGMSTVLLSTGALHVMHAHLLLRLGRA